MMSKTSFNIVTIILAILIFALLSLLPIYPLLVEGRKISSAGESLYQEWKLVSLSDYFEYSRFANVAWLESTDRVYRILFFVYVLIVGVLSLVSARKVVNLLRPRITC